MSWQELETICGYLDPQQDMVSLLGGEPTLHSQFKEIVEYFSNKGFPIKIFTNGVTSGLRSILDLALDDIRIILNLNEPASYNSKEWQQIEKNCQAFTSNIALSFNVYKPDFDWTYLKEAILGWGMDKFIRIGIAQPIKGMKNAYLQDKDTKMAAQRLVAMAEDLAEDGISIGFDCGFRSCDFTREELGILAQCGTGFLFDCKPVLDIGPDLMTWRCFPFSVGPGVKLTDFGSFKELEQFYTDKWLEIQKTGNTEKCPTCDNLEIASCGGGCLSRTVLKSGLA